MKKLGFNNLSHSFLTEERNSLNKNYSLIANSLPSLKIDTKKPVKQTSFINININLNNVLKNNLTITNQKSKNKSHMRNFKKSSNSLSKNSTKIISMNRNIKSMAVLPVAPTYNINGISEYSLNKINRILYNDAKNNNISSINSTTAQNSIKTNQNINSNNDLLNISPKIKPIRKVKSKQRLNTHDNINSSTPNILKESKKTINANKEKPYKIFDHNLYKNYKNKNKKGAKKDKFIIKSPDKKDNNDSNNKKKVNKQLNNTADINNNKNQNIFAFLEKEKQSGAENKSENKEKDRKIYNITGSNENSDETKKESCLNLHKVFDQKIMDNINKKSIINGIISNNMKINDKNISRNNNNQNININEQITINVENSNNNIINIINNIPKSSKADDNEDCKYISTQKLSLTHIDINMKNEFKNIIKKYSNSLSNSENKNNEDHNESMNNNNMFNCEEDEKEEVINYNHNKDEENKINYSDINKCENIQPNNNDVSNNNEENSSMKTHKNMYKKLCDLNNMQEMSKKEEQEIQGEQDNKSGQTQTTVDKSNIISKFMKQPMYNISPRFLINEVSLNTKFNLPNKSFMFINDIEKENKSLPIINYKKILKLNDKCIFNLLSYSYDNYSFTITSLYPTNLYIFSSISSRDFSISAFNFFCFSLILAIGNL